MSVKLTIEPKTKYHFANSTLPLAVYREVVAHLRQVEGVEAGLILASLNSNQEKFDYNQSQIEALWIESSQVIEAPLQQRLNEIFDYYARRYSPWQSLIIE